MTRSLLVIMADAWEHVMRTTEDPFRTPVWYWGGPQPSYRDRLDRAIVNCYGETVPRIDIVRNNIRQLGDPHLSPDRIPN